MILTIHIVEHGTDLSSRSTGRRIREVAELRAETGSVILDFAGVHSVTHSFADELLAVLVAQKGETWFKNHIRVRNHNSDIRLTLLDAIDQRLKGKPLRAA